MPVLRGVVARTFPELVADYVRDGELRIEFRGLTFIGPEFEQALRAALAAGEQEKLWNVVDLVYANQGAENAGWVTEDFLRAVGAAVPELDVDRMLEASDSAEVTAAIEEAAADAEADGISGTPSFLLGETGGELQRAGDLVPGAGGVPHGHRRAAPRVNDRPLRIAVAALALLGTGIAAYLTYAKYADATIACATGGCETVQSSEYAEVLGLPVPVLGLLGYLAILATAFAGETGSGFGAAPSPSAGLQRLSRRRPDRRHRRLLPVVPGRRHRHAPSCGGDRRTSAGASAGAG